MMIVLLLLMMIILKVPRRSAQADDEEALTTRTLARYFSFPPHALKVIILQQLRKQKFIELLLKQRR